MLLNKYYSFEQKCKLDTVLYGAMLDYVKSDMNERQFDSFCNLSREEKAKEFSTLFKELKNFDLDSIT